LQLLNRRGILRVRPTIPRQLEQHQSFLTRAGAPQQAVVGVRLVEQHLDQCLVGDGTRLRPEQDAAADALQHSLRLALFPNEREGTRGIRTVVPAESLIFKDV
jgi:hypothetical protein